MFIFYQLLFIFPFLFHAFTQASDIEYGVLVAETASDKENFCIIYFKEFFNLPSKKSDAEFHILKDDSDKDWCDDNPESDIKSKVLLLTNRNCSITTQASNVFDRGGEGILFITPSGMVNDVDVNATIAENINMTVALISENSAERLKKMQESVSVLLFAPHDEGFDYSLLVIWVIAVFAVTVGSYWSGLIRFAIYCREMNSLPGGAREFPNKPSVTVNNIEDSSINISPFAIAGFVTCMGIMLLLLYFFYAYLVYFIIALFVVAGILSVHSCLEVLVLKIKLSCCKAQFRCGAKSCNIDFRQVLLVAFAFAISIYWVIIRKQKGAWILQDILGTSFCIHMLKSIRLSSFKICSILLILLFFYDIFFVFITPLLTGKAESVMEEVATGAGSNSEESLPMVIKVPHFGFSTVSICYQQYSILGLGDILVPGLLVSYCHGFDLVSNKKKLYFLTTVTAYGIGMLVTFVGLFLMNTAQPALLYLVPCTLLPPAILGWCRGEFSALWNGFRMGQPANTSQFPEVQVEDNASSVEPHEESSVLPQSNHSVQKDINLMKDNTTRTDRVNLLQ